MKPGGWIAGYLKIMHVTVFLIFKVQEYSQTDINPNGISAAQYSTLFIL